MFNLNDQLLCEARAMLASRPDLYWVVGGAGSGKSTICRALAASSGAELVDMDAHIYGTFFDHYDGKHYPAAATYFTRDNPLDWALSLSWETFNALNRATTAEYIHLLARDLQRHNPAGPLVIDGGITHPGLAARVIPAAQIACLTVPDDLRVRLWLTAVDRAEMRRWIRALPDPDAKWRTFLQFDQGIADVVVAESTAHAIAVFERDASTAVADLTATLASYFRLPARTPDGPTL